MIDETKLEQLSVGTLSLEQQAAIMASAYELAKSEEGRAQIGKLLIGALQTQEGMRAYLVRACKEIEGDRSSHVQSTAQLHNHRRRRVLSWWILAIGFAFADCQLIGMALTAPTWTMWNIIQLTIAAILTGAVIGCKPK